MDREPAADIPATEPSASAPAPAPAPDAAPAQQPAAPGPTEPAPAEAPQPSKAEQKKQAKAEKQARRAREKALRDQTGASPSLSADSIAQTSAQGSTTGGKGSTPLSRSPLPIRTTPDSPASAKGQKLTQQQQQQHQLQQQQQQQQVQNMQLAQAAEAARRADEDNAVAVFKHLSRGKRQEPVHVANRDVHPAVLMLGLQFSQYIICGSTARTIAMLITFKRVVESYVTPMNTSLPRHITTVLSHQIAHIASCRPLSISMGNAIRALKLEIVKIDPAEQDEDAKASLCDIIDSFIRERLTIADDVIALQAANKINDGDVILCYACSAVVTKALINAHRQGKRFRVSIVDSRPLFEGRSMAARLSNAGIEVQYWLITGLHHALQDVTKVLLGAHAMMGNGMLYSRVGTALVAMTTKENASTTPVIILCESLKFTDRIALDSIVFNEMGDADDLISTDQTTSRGDFSRVNEPVERTEAGEPIPSAADLEVPLRNWKEKPNLQLLNMMYDVTPAEYLDMVITEIGNMPPSAVPVVHRLHTS